MPQSTKKVGSFAAESQGFHKFLWVIVTLQAWRKIDSFLSRRNRCKEQLALINSFAAPLAKSPKVEGGQSSWPKYIKIVKLVFCESFNWRHKNYSDRFLLEERGDRSLALLGVSKILRSQLVTKRRYRYLRKTHQWPVSTKCRLQTGYKMQNRYKMQTADCVQNADWGFKLVFFLSEKW